MYTYWKSETNRSKAKLSKFFGKKKNTNPISANWNCWINLFFLFFYGGGGWRVKQLLFTNDNFSSRCDRFSILKILQKFGSLKKFDFLYHKSGPDQGKSRGYCFASYDNKAVSFKACMDPENISMGVWGIIFVVSGRKSFTNALHEKRKIALLYTIIDMEVINSCNFVCRVLSLPWPKWMEN